MIKISHKIVQYSIYNVTLVGELKLYSVLENYRDLDKQPLSEALRLHTSKAVASSPAGPVLAGSLQNQDIF